MRTRALPLVLRSGVAPALLVVLAACAARTTATWTRGDGTRVAAQEDAEARRVARRQRVLAIAREYVELEWTADERNVRHGPAADGVSVETPDESHHPRGFRADGSVNRGMPYKWGGFSTIEEFLDGLARGLAAGDLPSEGSDRASAGAVGVDCSGFVSRCWELPLKQSTRSLGRLCYALEDWEELEPGDLLNSHDGHAQVFVEWADEEHATVRVIEAGFPCVAETEYAVALLQEHGLVPLRYKPLDPRWEELELGPARLVADEPASEPRFAPAGEAVELGPRAGALAGARRGDWARYVERDEQGAQPARELTRALLRGGEDELALRFLTTLDGGTLPTEQAVAADAPLVDLLLDFAGSGQRPDRHTLRVATRQEGTARFAGRELHAERLHFGLETAWVVRGTEYERWMELDCVRSDALPLEGVLWLRTTLQRSREDVEGAARWLEALTAAGGPAAGPAR